MLSPTFFHAEASKGSAGSGVLFAFFGRRKDALKVLFFDGSGMVIFSGAPHADVRHVEVDDATLEVLLAGIDVDLATETRSRTKTH